jgi:hypothetical protein
MSNTAIDVTYMRTVLHHRCMPPSAGFSQCSRCLNFHDKRYRVYMMLRQAIIQPFRPSTLFASYSYATVQTGPSQGPTTDMSKYSWCKVEVRSLTSHLASLCVNYYINVTPKHYNFLSNVCYPRVLPSPW